MGFELYSSHGDSFLFCDSGETSCFIVEYEVATRYANKPVWLTLTLSSIAVVVPPTPYHLGDNFMTSSMINKRAPH